MYVCLHVKQKHVSKIFNNTYIGNMTIITTKPLGLLLQLLLLLYHCHLHCHHHCHQKLIIIKTNSSGEGSSANDDEIGLGA